VALKKKAFELYFSWIVHIAAALVSLKGHNRIRRQPNFADRDFFVFKR
jgi:hypothetical protein